MTDDNQESGTTIAPDKAALPEKSYFSSVFAWCIKIVVAVIVMCIGALYGIGAYELFAKVFSKPSGLSGLMLVSFLAGIPLVIGLIVATIGNRKKNIGVAATGALSMSAIGLCVFAAGALLREGMICIVMALPFFLGLTLVGAVLGWIISQASKRNGPKILGIALILPFAFGSAERQIVPPQATQKIHRSIHIAAAPETVWLHINQPTGIKPAELEGGFAYKIGVPYPIEARTIEPRVGGKRKLAWQRGIRFEEEITQWQPNCRIAWKYHFQPGSFPEGSLDDHIVIGGQYFNLVDTAYTLTPEAGGTRLEVDVSTTVSTNFNWYAGLWARFLVDDTAQAILKFYKHRAEAPVAAG